MQQFSNYKIIETTNVEELQRLVNLYLSKGWEPIGGIAMTTPISERQSVQFAQAIVVKEGSDNLKT